MGAVAEIADLVNVMTLLLESYPLVIFAVKTGGHEVILSNLQFKVKVYCLVRRLAQFLRNVSG